MICYWVQFKLFIPCQCFYPRQIHTMRGSTFIVKTCMWYSWPQQKQDHLNISFLKNLASYFRFLTISFSFHSLKPPWRQVFFYFFAPMHVLVKVTLIFAESCPLFMTLSPPIDWRLSFNWHNNPIMRPSCELDWPRVTQYNDGKTLVGWGERLYTAYYRIG